MELYCQKDKNTGDYRHFFNSQIAVTMCGVKKENIVKVSISEAADNEGNFWAYKDLEEGIIRFIFSTEIQVKMCSSDFFESDIQEGRGKIIKVKVEEIQN